MIFLLLYQKFQSIATFSEMNWFACSWLSRNIHFPSSLQYSSMSSAFGAKSLERASSNAKMTMQQSPKKLHLSVDCLNRSSYHWPNLMVSIRELPANFYWHLLLQKDQPVRSHLAFQTCVNFVDFNVLLTIISKQIGLLYWSMSWFILAQILPLKQHLCYLGSRQSFPR